jgi:RNA polymerase sigma-70 factor (ECF subfamily)
MTLTTVVTQDQVGDDEQQAADLVAAALAGDRVATYRLMASLQPAVMRYCRARLGNGELATEVARRVCRSVATTLPDLVGSESTVHAFAYQITVDAVDAVQAPEGLPGMAGMLALLSPSEREVLVLRVAVGLSAEATASALGSTPGAVRQVQHHALARLRSAA